MGNLTLNKQTNEILDEVGKVVGTLVKEPKVAQPLVNSRTLEKLLVYGAGLVAATNGFAQLSMPNSVRSALMGASALVVLGIHHSSVKS